MQAVYKSHEDHTEALISRHIEREQILNIQQLGPTVKIIIILFLVILRPVLILLYVLNWFTEFI